MKRIGCASPLKLIVVGVNLALVTGGAGSAIALPNPGIAKTATETIGTDGSEVAKDTQMLPATSFKVEQGNRELGIGNEEKETLTQEKEETEISTLLPTSLTTNVATSSTISTPQENFIDLNSPEYLDVENSPDSILIEPVTPVAQLQLSDVQPTEANNPELETSIEREIDAEDGLIEPGMEQITSVSQLSDVRPTDWAYQALANLVQRYGCIVGYPDGTYRGNRAMTRYEFAAGLNACLNRISEILAGSTGSGVNTGDLDSIRKLQAEFTSELSTLQTQTDGLEQRIAFQEKTQFSTTTTLSGTVDMSMIGGFGDLKAVPSGQNPSQDLEVNTILSGRAAINFDTSFTGRDLLRTSRGGGSIDPFGRAVTGTDMTALGFGLDNDNNIGENSIFYRFPLGSNGVVHLGTAGVSARSIMPALNPTISISRFGGGNPIYGLAGGGGIGMQYRFSDKLALGFNYSGGTGSIANPNGGNGLFNGQYTAFTQVTFTPSTKLGIALNYAHHYTRRANLTGSTGSDFAERPFGGNTPTSANAFGLQGQYRFITRFSMGAWVEYINATAESSFRVNGINGTKGDEADIWNWAITAALQDVGKRGSQLGFVFGMPPKLTDNDFSSREDGDTSYHIEAFYRYRYSDRIFITPSVLLITNPEHNNNNNDIWILSLRTSFIF